VNSVIGNTPSSTLLLYSLLSASPSSVEIVLHFVQPPLTHSREAVTVYFRLHSSGELVWVAIPDALVISFRRTL